MLKTLRNAFKIKDVRRRLFYVLLMLVVVRIGSQLPIPGVDSNYFKNWFASQSSDAFNFFDAFTGGSFTEMSIFALSITPYITSSIIIQLLTIAFKTLEDMQRDGEEGRKKLTAITRYVTIGLALFQSIAMTIGFGNKGLIPDINFLKGVVVVCCLTAGSAMLMWIGEQITEKGVGNGISIILMINIGNSRCSSTGFNLKRWCKKNSGTVFQKDGRKKSYGRSVQLHSFKSKHSRCYSYYLCFLFNVFPGYYYDFNG